MQVMLVFDRALLLMLWTQGHFGVGASMFGLKYHVRAVMWFVNFAVETEQSSTEFWAYSIWLAFICVQPTLSLRRHCPLLDLNA